MKKEKRQIKGMDQLRCNNYSELKYKRESADTCTSYPETDQEERTRTKRSNLDPIREKLIGCSRF